MKILLFGGTGKLGREIIRLSRDIEAPLHRECDILESKKVWQIIKKINPDVIIHAAALVGTKECEDNRERAWNVNVEGTQNIVKAARNLKKRLIFISSAAVFDGNKGNYKEIDVPTPSFYYAVTKIAAEQAVRTLENYVIVRLDFFSLSGFKYQKVFTDHFTSKITISEAAEKILKIAESNFQGIINIGRERETLFNILKRYYLEIEPIKISESTLPSFPKDLSLDLSLWKKCFENS